MSDKQPIKKKQFLSEQQKQERRLREKKKEILNNRSEGLKEWIKKHGSAEMILDIVMNALDYVPKAEKEVIVKYLRMPLLDFNHNHTDYLAYENDIDDMDAVFELLREIHDVSAQEVGLESYKEYSDNLYSELKKERAKRRRRRKVEEEDIEPYVSEASDEVWDDDLPF